MNILHKIFIKFYFQWVNRILSNSRYLFKSVWNDISRCNLFYFEFNFHFKLRTKEIVIWKKNWVRVSEEKKRRHSLTWKRWNSHFQHFMKHLALFKGSTCEKKLMIFLDSKPTDNIYTARLMNLYKLLSYYTNIIQNLVFGSLQIGKVRFSTLNITISMCLIFITS